MGKYLNHFACKTFWDDPHHRFRKLFGKEGWMLRQEGEDACWGEDGYSFWRGMWGGVNCGVNWYTGTPGVLGDVGPTTKNRMPHFTGKAPALLGFDESIDRYCHAHAFQNGPHSESCVFANVNILSLYGNQFPAPYNTCRNIEWQVCAARGHLHGQGDNRIRFAVPPRVIEIYTGNHPIGGCKGYAPRGCGPDKPGFASGDIFILEVCFYDAICQNNEELWTLEAGQDWRCNLDEKKYDDLRDKLLYRKLFPG